MLQSQPVLLTIEDSNNLFRWLITLDDSDLKGDVEMTLAISGAYRSTTDRRKVHIMTQQGHILKLDGAAGTAAIAMGDRE